MDKKLYLAQLAAKAMSCYSDEDVVCDSLWLMNGGIGYVDVNVGTRKKFRQVI